MRRAEVEGVPHREIAARLGLSLAATKSATKSRIRRGRLRLKQTLEQCCHFEFDRRGNLTDVTPRADRTVCLDCETLVEWSELGPPRLFLSRRSAETHSTSPRTPRRRPVG